jgi:adenylate cyclase
MRELSLGALQAWQALSEAQGRGRGTVDVAILFTDIVGFSSWALEAGDEAALELLRQVASVEDEAISAHGGSLVKRLGDGSMSVFRAASDGVGAALRAQAGAREIEVRRHRPELRAGVHVGRPRRVGRDYLGVDVNIAARVAESAKGGEVLVSETARERLDTSGFAFGRNKHLSASGAPRGFAVCRVTAR